MDHPLPPPGMEPMPAVLPKQKRRKRIKCVVLKMSMGNCQKCHGVAEPMHTPDDENDLTILCARCCGCGK